MNSKALHPGVDPSCPTCFGIGAHIVRQGAVAVAQRCSCVQRCPLCNEHGWVDDTDNPRARRRCRCRRLAHRMELFDRAHIPGRHAGSTRRSFRDDGQPTLTAAMMAVSGWLKRFEPGQENRGLVLHGEVGRGKTHLMVAILRELVLLHGVRVRFVEFSLLLADIKTGFDVGQGTHRLIQPLVDADVLAIDELGKGRNTEFEGTVLDELISRRYNAALPVLATTNYEPQPATGVAVANQAQLATGTAPPPTLPDRVGARVYSRLEETCDFVPVRGLDYRSERRKAGSARLG